MPDTKDPQEEKEESFEEILAEEPTEETTDDTKPTDEPETPLETTPEPQEPIKEDEPDEPEVPLEEITEAVIKKTKDEVKQDVLKALGVTEDEKVEVEDQGFKFAWETRGEDAPGSWKEQSEETIRFWEFQKKQQDAELQETQKQSLAQAKEREATLNADWDSQLDYLRSESMIPNVDAKIVTKLKEGKVLSVQERQDPGLVAQAQIFDRMYEVSQEREKVGQPPIMDVVHIFNRYYKKVEPTGTQGKKAPVSGGTVPLAGMEEDISYKELHEAKGFEDLL